MVAKTRTVGSELASKCTDVSLKRCGTPRSLAGYTKAMIGLHYASFRIAHMVVPPYCH